MKNIFLSVFLLSFAFTVFAQQNEEADIKPDTIIEVEHTEDIPVFTFSADELSEDFGEQGVSPLLQSSRDVYTSMAGYNFGQARFRIRGYNNEHTTVLINGVNVNEMESGRPIWSFWGGLNDITRWHENRTGIAFCPVAFSGIGGYSNIQTNAASNRKGTRVSYAAANRSYNNRLMLTSSTGLMENGWAFTLSGSRRWAQEGYVEGTFYDAWSYFGAAEKRINNRHSVGLVAYGTPVRSGGAGLAIQEAYDLTGNNFYNPYWGYQDGVKRNARVRDTHRPMIMLSHYFQINDNSKLNTTAFYSFGKSGYTRLNWYDASNPNPDYYRYFPGFWQNNEYMYNYYTNLWQNDEEARQIDWDHFYFANSKNLYTVYDVDGISGSNITGNRSKYILEEARSDHAHTGFATSYSNIINENISLQGGVSLDRYKGYNFNTVKDLLGGDFWVDVDQFAERDFDDPVLAQNDLNNINRVVYEDDRFGYDYVANINKEEGFLQALFSYNKFDFNIAANLSQSTYWRTGNMKNGKFPDNSYGDSEKQSFLNYGAKLGLVYKLTGRHIFTANGAYLTRAPSFRNTYISPRTRDHVTTDLQSETVLSGDINYLIRYPNFKARLTYYYTEINDQTWNRSFYHDVYRTFVNYQMSGVDHLHTGVELGVDYNITSSIIFTGAFTKGENIWNSRPNVTIARDNSAELIAENRTAYMKNYKIGGMPQTAASGGLRYNGKQFWFAGFNFNYFSDIYLSMNPDRRTEEALGHYVYSDPQWHEIIDQTKLDDNYTLDAYFGKSWRVRSSSQTYFINVNINVSNILNNKDFVIGGFEQLRYDSSDIDKFSPKFSYLYGRTYFAMLSLRF